VEHRCGTELCGADCRGADLRGQTSVERTVVRWTTVQRTFVGRTPWSARRTPVRRIRRAEARDVAQGLEPFANRHSPARLKPCPDTNLAWSSAGLVKTWRCWAARLRLERRRAHLPAALFRGAEAPRGLKPAPQPRQGGSSSQAAGAMPNTLRKIRSICADCGPRRARLWRVSYQGPSSVGPNRARIFTGFSPWISSAVFVAGGLIPAPQTLHTTPLNMQAQVR